MEKKEITRRINNKKRGIVGVYVRIPEEYKALFHKLAEFFRKGTELK